MHRDPNFLQNLRAELSNGRLWLERSVVLAYAMAAGLAIVGFTLLGDWAFGLFLQLYHRQPWMVLLWTPAITAAIAR